VAEPAGSNEARLVAYLVPKAGKEAELAAAIKEILPDVQREPGCITYIAHESREHPGTIVMYEAWESDAVLDAHVASAPFMKLAARFDDLLGEPLRLEHLTQIA
jgi:quinol monooxygenase YgiN